jgi:DNA polymerase III subunit beta
MKVTCQRDALLAACQIVQVACKAAASTTKPILANIKAIAQDDALILMATDTEIGIRYELRGMNVGRAGEAILPVGRLVSILRESTSPELTIDCREESTLVRVGTGRYELPSGDPMEFPDIPVFDAGGQYHEITAGVLRTMIKRTAFAADKKEGARWAVTGVLWEAEGERARFVATDTKRLAMIDGTAALFGDRPEGKAHSHLIPLKAVTLLERNLSDAGESIRVALRPNFAMFQTERAMIHTRLVEGKFPPYQQIVPKKLAVKLTLPAADFFSRVRQAAITTDEDSKRVEFRFEPGKLTLQARGADAGSSEVELPLPDYDGESVELALDPAYVGDMFRAIDGEPTITIEFTDNTKPVLFRLPEANYTYLVMPLGERGG